MKDKKAKSPMDREEQLDKLRSIHRALKANTDPGGVKISVSSEHQLLVIVETLISIVEERVADSSSSAGEG